MCTLPPKLDLQLAVKSIVEIRKMGFSLCLVNEISHIEKTTIAFHSSEKSSKQILQSASWVKITILPPGFQHECCQPVIDDPGMMRCGEESFGTVW